MPHHKAATQGSQIDRGLTLVIRSGVLRRGDILEVERPEGKQIQAVIERFDPGGLFLIVGSQRLQCRPWRMGDANTDRLSGTVSTWTVEAVTEATGIEAA